MPKWYSNDGADSSSTSSNVCSSRQIPDTRGRCSFISVAPDCDGAASSAVPVPADSLASRAGGTRDPVLGRLLKFDNPSNARRMVRCASSTTDAPKSERGDVMDLPFREDSEFKDPECPFAEAVANTPRPAPVIESSYWPPPCFDLPEDSMDKLQCDRFTMEHKAATRAPAMLQDAAAEYFEVVTKFAAQQTSRLDEDVKAHFESQDGIGNASRAAERYKQAWRLMQIWWRSPGVQDLREAHATFGTDLCTDPGEFRRNHVRIGHTDLMPPEEVPNALVRYVQWLDDLMRREDLSAPAKAAWAGYHLLTTHPFVDGNGLLARLLISWVLKSCGVPFPLVLCWSKESRQTWQDALCSGHSVGGSPHPLAMLVASTLSRAWTDLENMTTTASKNREVAAEDKFLGKARKAAREGVCGICLDSDPNMMQLCCGAGYHLDCMARWLESAREPVCPTCRAKMPRLRPPPAERETFARGPDLTDAYVRLSFDRAPPVPARLVQTGRLQARLVPLRVGEVHPASSGMVTVLPQGRDSDGGQCTFCSNMRAVDCSIGACGRCCEAQQRQYGIHCLRHSMEVGLTVFRTADGTGTSQSSGSRPEPAAPHSPAFVPQDFLTGGHHDDIFVVSDLLHADNPESEPVVHQIPLWNFDGGHGGMVGVSSPPPESDDQFNQFAPAPLMRPGAGPPMAARRQIPRCVFCDVNQQASYCDNQACRRCCVNTTRPCVRHANQ